MPALEPRDIYSAEARTEGWVRTCGEGAIRRGVVWSNRLGKLTKSRRLSVRSWVTDFQQRHYIYTYAPARHYANVYASSFACTVRKLYFTFLRRVCIIMQICDLVYEVLGWWLYLRWFDVPRIAWRT